ncbi:molybdopterin biosynthesis protein [Rhodovulum sp. BSW8]|uniref:Molybdenum cofactor cytidylyltransferase n=1 Tax=Rhodovulum visakhapatnamense TaxID=364297 RepID=A0A4R8G0U3_9RHOB|nr:MULTISPECIES: molybdopterin-binding protein [Rhodovulum]RBO54531.1 molybdopterin biosynthesis protein [Rhodovulum sp. BSW8]TDX30198.1 molybdenum cofactor cytidylyltransferase [Rhodovulum visakhapatnamense]
MRFGPVPPAEAEGAILAHSLTLAGRRLQKGRILTAEDGAALAAAGIASVTVARPDPDDVTEDAAAARLAAALVPDPLAAALRIGPAARGRVNLHAVGPGVVGLDAAAVQAINRVDPGITLATLAPLVRVAPGMLVGTVKILPYAVPGRALALACQAGRSAVRVHPVQRRSAGLILSEVAGQKPGLTAKGAGAVEARLTALGISLDAVRVVPHEAGAMAAVLADLPGEIGLILTGSATSDPRDVGPEAVRLAGGTVERFGMPVDPGNLLFLGAQGGRPVIGLPGCARSPALNGADWVLERVACGIEVDAAAIADMAVGGLLKEIPSRPQPREA